MAGKLKHRFVSAKSDDPDTTLVQASDWNDSLVASEGSAWQFARRSTGATDGWEWEDPSTVLDARKYDVVAGDGTNQTANIEAACAAASSGDLIKTVLLPPGVIYCVGLNLSNYKVHLRGHTDGNTTLRRYTDTDHVIKIESSSSKNHWMFSDFRIDGRIPAGTASTTYDGIYVQPSSGTISFVDFFRIYSTSNRYGIQLGSNTTLCTVTNCVFGSDNQYGLALTSNGTRTTHRIIGNWFDENLARGLFCRSSGNIITGNNFLDNTTVHIYLDADADDNLTIGNHFRAGSQYGTATVYRVFGNSNEFLWNTISDAHSGNDLIIDAGATDNVFLGRFLDSLVFSNSGTNSMIWRINDGGQWLNPAGTAVTAPGYSFVGDTNTGLYRSGGDELQFVTGGVAAMIARSAQRCDFTSTINPMFGTATAAGGALAITMGSADVGISWGSGAPSLSAAKGSIYLRTDGSTTNDRMYVATDAVGGWTAVTTAT